VVVSRKKLEVKLKMSKAFRGYRKSSRTPAKFRMCASDQPLAKLDQTGVKVGGLGYTVQYRPDSHLRYLRNMSTMQLVEINKAWNSRRGTTLLVSVRPLKVLFCLKVDIITYHTRTSFVPECEISVKFCTVYFVKAPRFRINRGLY
jgi:hypothetical protein